MIQIPIPTISEILYEEFIIPMNINVNDIPIKNIQAVLNNEVEIDKSMSKKLASFFGVSDMFFFKLQNDIKARNMAAMPELQYA